MHRIAPLAAAVLAGACGTAPVQDSAELAPSPSVPSSLQSGNSQIQGSKAVTGREEAAVASAPTGSAYAGELVAPPRPPVAADRRP
jgi:hypothetical protein